MLPKGNPLGMIQQILQPVLGALPGAGGKGGGQKPAGAPLPPTPRRLLFDPSLFEQFLRR